jgi:hypothetical protein
MYRSRMAAAVALLSTITSTEIVAQSFSEPAAFEAQHPDRDVLNRGALTPAAGAAAGLESLARADDTGGGGNSASSRGAHERFRLHRSQSK